MSPRAVRLSDSRTGRLFQAVSSGAAARVFTGVISLLTLPLGVRYLGAERYGVWATITTTAVWINLLDLGIANTLTNEISRAFALGDKETARRYFTNALFLTGVFAASVGLLFARFGRQVSWARVLNVSADVSPIEVERTVFTAVALMLLALPCNLVNKLLAGYQELPRCFLANALGALASLAGLSLGIALHVRMPLLYAMSLGCVTFATLVMLLVVLCQKPWLLPKLSVIDFHSMKRLLDSGSSFFLIQVAAVVVFSSDNVIVSHYLGASQVTPYSVTWRIAGLAAVLQSLMFPALWPAYAEAYAKREFRWIRQTFASTLKGIVALNILLRVRPAVLRKDCDSNVGWRSGGPGHLPADCDGGLDHCERLYERRVLPACGAESHPRTGRAVDDCRVCKHRAVCWCSCVTSARSA